MGSNCLRGIHGGDRSHNFIPMVYWPGCNHAILDTKACSRPIRFVWDRADESVQGRCFDVDKFFKGSGSVNVFLNFVVFMLVGQFPWWVVVD